MFFSQASRCEEGEPAQSSEEFARRAMEFREEALKSIAPKVLTPVGPRPSPGAWRENVVTTVFCVGGSGQKQSAWDAHWAQNFGGYDNPKPAARIANALKGEFRPAAFVPRLNPFYVALPYNDVAKGRTKPEARAVIPWFRQAFVREGQSVCHNHWVAIRDPRTGKVAYAQWSDCGPGGGTQFEYVFGTDRPKARRGGAGLDISPAVRDYLGVSGGRELTDWRFAEVREVPAGPWRKYGENNDFVLQERASAVRVKAVSSP